MPPIRVLPAHLVNKIAAGEVIERPASVVKELVENSLDAGATRIDVAVEDGGRKFIQVSDDGCGMGAEDVALAFAPHATSKIASEEDLGRIATMGFRGEALASIASISHAHIRSRRRDAPEAAGGHEAEAAGEMIGAARPCPASPGTTVTIRDLFFNTPARRKFLRTANTELSHIIEQLTRLALPHPHVGFSLTHNGREVKNLPAAASTVQRVADLFGAELAEMLLPLVRRRGRVDVAGLIAPPAQARGSGRWQYFFLNGRYIRDRLLSHAVREAFRGRIDPNDWPAAFIFIQVDPAEVDVNAHPTKIEVRFRDSQLIHGELLAGLTETLNRADLSPRVALGTVPAGPVSGPAGPAKAGKPATADDDVPVPGAAAPPAHPCLPAVGRQVPEAGKAGGPPGGAAGGPLGPQPTAGVSFDRSEDGGLDDQRRSSLRQALADFFQSIPPAQPRLSFPEPGAPRRTGTPGTMPAGTPIPAGQPPPGGQPSPGRPWPRPEQAATETPPGRADMPSAGADDSAPPPAYPCLPLPTCRRQAGAAGGQVPEAGRAVATALARPAFQVDDSYIVAACDDGLVIIDQHALHERLLYNQLGERLARGRLAGQRMLLPQPVNVTAREADLLHQHAGLLGRLGIEVAEFGPHAVAVQQFPALLAERGLNAGEFLRDLLDRLGEGAPADAERLLTDVLAMMACKAAVKAGSPLTPAEMAELLARAEEVDKSAACPHGRPTMLRLTLRDLQRQFRRT